MGIDLEHIPGQTPLDADETDGLLIPSIATNAELNEFEQQNIEHAMQWILTRSFKPAQILSEDFVRDLHRRMYMNVWRWAGEFRNTDKNIGTTRWKIRAELAQLLRDSQYWVENGTFSPDETAVRFKHRLVSIHCFCNGNGRHSRLVADIIAEKIFGREVFSWGSTNLGQGDARSVYIRAVEAADAGDITKLLAFARS